MTTIQLDPATDRRLAALATATGRPAAEILHEALDVYLQDLEDARLAGEVLERMERGEEAALSLEEVERRLGLGG